MLGSLAHVTFDRPGPAGPPRRTSAPTLSRRGRVLLPTAFIFGALLVLFSLFTGFYTDLLWYRSVGYSSVFTRTLGARALLFLVGGLLFAGVIVVNLVVAYRTRPVYQAMLPGQAELDRYRMAMDPFRKLVVIALAAMLGLIAGTSAAGEWRTYLQWRNSVPFGETDAQFGKDISFFTFDLPWYRFMLGFAVAMVVVSLIAAAVTHYLYGGLRLQPVLGERATPAAQVHLSVLVGLFVLLRAIGYWLDRYTLAVGEHRIGKADFTGLTYTDLNAVLQGRTILAIISVVLAGLFFANIFRRTWMLPGIGVGLLLLSALLVGGVYPALVQRFQVAPNEVDKEAPYIRRNIEATRVAYGIDDVKVTEYASGADSGEPPGAATGDTPEDAGSLRAAAESTANIRLVDPQLMSPTFRNLQQFRPYYDFADVLDVDRYQIGGEDRDVVVAVRELSLDGLPDEQRNWINDSTVYTHGFGFVAAYAEETSDGGRPSFAASDIPVEGQIPIEQPRIYFGEESPTYSIVGAEGERELDFPDETRSGVRRTSYDGAGGVPVGSFFRRLLFAMKYQESNLLLSGRVTDDAKILYTRDPRDRVRKVAPWLTLDRDPYPAVIDGRIQWIVDGYTTSNGYPYSTRSTLEEATTDSQTSANAAVIAPVERVNYIRNSVKATVDAYDGTVTLYAWDEQDPVLKVWRKVFPGVVKDRSEIDADLMDNLRYPEDLFKVQRTLLANYHVNGPKTFYSGADFWRIPDDPTRPGDEAQPPYYLTLRMPDQDEAAFSLTSTYVPTGRRENAAAFVSVNADPGEDYGQFRVLELPRSSQINGPAQVQNQLESDADIADEINILKRGTQVEYGNLLTVPVGGGLLYVEPVYVQAESALSFPLLRKVLVSYGNQVAFEDSLDEALDSLFGEEGTAPPTDPEQPEQPNQPEPPATGDDNPALTEALADAERALNDAEAALAAGDFTAYGEAQQRLADAIQRAVDARQGAAAPAPTGSPSPSPASTG